jgi:hypothetical protein
MPDDILGRTRRTFRGVQSAPERRCRLFYSETEQCGTGHDEYNSLGDCVLTLLQVQQTMSDNWRISSGATRADLDDDYHDPVNI